MTTDQVLDKVFGRAQNWQTAGAREKRRATDPRTPPEGRLACLTLYLGQVSEETMFVDTGIKSVQEQLAKTVLELAVAAYLWLEHELRAATPHRSDRDLAENIRQMVHEERERQTSRFTTDGLRRNAPLVWVLVLTEEVGEVACEVLERRNPMPGRPPKPAHLHAELVQVIAVCSAWLEYGTAAGRPALLKAGAA